MFSIYDGRTSFFQYDLNRKLVIEDKTITKVHFCNRTGSCSLIRCAYEVNGLWLVDVPNVILQESYRINVYGFDSEYTKHSASFNVVARTKPEDYIYTENEVATWEALEERITQIEENGVSDETIAAAIDNYLVENPIEAGATAEQAAQIEVNKTAIEELEREAATHATTSYVDNAVKNVKPDLTGYATETYVNQQIANAQLGGGDVDLSNYYTKAETNAAINAAKPDLSSYATQQWVKNQNYLTQHQDLSSYAKKSEIPSLNGYATQSWVEGKGYLTQHQSLAAYALKSEIPDVSGYAKTTDIPDVSGYQTAEQVNAAIVAYVGVIENGSY